MLGELPKLVFGGWLFRAAQRGACLGCKTSEAGQAGPGWTTEVGKEKTGAVMEGISRVSLKALREMT